MRGKSFAASATLPSLTPFAVDDVPSLQRGKARMEGESATRIPPKYARDPANRLNC